MKRLALVGVMLAVGLSLAGCASSSDASTNAVPSDQTTHWQKSVSVQKVLVPGKGYMDCVFYDDNTDQQGGISCNWGHYSDDDGSSGN